jgi:hypothetical protein
MNPTIQALVDDLRALGYDDPDEPISGTETVDVICTHWKELQKLAEPPKPDPWQKCPGCHEELSEVCREERIFFNYSVDEKGEHVETEIEECMEVLTPTRCVNCNADVTSITDV